MDAPRDDLRSASDLAHVYWAFFRWSCVEAYPAIACPRRCKTCRPAQARQLGRKPFTYCSDECWTETCRGHVLKQVQGRLAVWDGLNMERRGCHIGGKGHHLDMRWTVTG